MQPLYSTLHAMLLYYIPSIRVTDMNKVDILVNLRMNLRKEIKFPLLCILTQINEIEEKHKNIKSLFRIKRTRQCVELVIRTLRTVNDIRCRQDYTNLLALAKQCQTIHVTIQWFITSWPPKSKAAEKYIQDRIIAIKRISDLISKQIERVQLIETVTLQERDRIYSDPGHVQKVKRLHKMWVARRNLIKKG